MPGRFYHHLRRGRCLHAADVQIHPARKINRQPQPKVGQRMNDWTPPHPPQRPTGLRCPRCNASRIDCKNQARKAGSTVGFVLGAFSGAATVWGGAEIGSTIGMVAGPPGAVIGGLAGAIFAALFGGAAGCAVGASLGEVVDDKILDNFHCMRCHHHFSKPPAET